MDQSCESFFSAEVKRFGGKACKRFVPVFLSFLELSRHIYDCWLWSHRQIEPFRLHSTLRRHIDDGLVARSTKRLQQFAVSVKVSSPLILKVQKLFVLSSSSNCPYAKTK